MKLVGYLKKWLPIGIAALAAAAGLSMYPDFPLEVYCGCIEPLQSKAPLRENLRSCTSLAQHIDWEHSFNIAQTPSEKEGWDVLSPADPSLPARLCLVVVRDRSEAVWYPRLSGQDGSIELLADDDPGLRLMDRISGGKEWTPIGAQRPVNLRCLKYGYLKGKDIPIRLVFQLTGRWTQIWTRQGAIIF